MIDATINMTNAEKVSAAGTEGASARARLTIDATNAEKTLCENVTPLYLAAQEGRLAMVRLLLQHGAQPDLAVSAAAARGDLGPRRGLTRARPTSRKLTWQVYNTGRKKFYTPVSAAAARRDLGTRRGLTRTRPTSRKLTWQASVALMFGRVRCYRELRAASKRQRRAASGRGYRRPLLLRASGCGRLPKETFALELDDDNYL